MYKVLILLALLGLSAHAEIPLLPEHSRPLPSFQEAQKHRLTRFKGYGLISATDDPAQTKTDYDTDALAAALTDQFKTALAPLNSPAPACESEESGDYARALYTAGRLDECAAYAKSCAQNPGSTNPAAILYGAQSETLRYRSSAAELYQAAADPRFAHSPHYESVVYSYAAYKMYSEGEEAAARILALIPSWSKSDRTLYAGVFKRLGQMDLGALTKSEVDQFLDDKISATSGSLRDTLAASKLQIEGSVDYNYAQALADLALLAPTIKDPLLWYYPAYTIIYYGLDQDFAEARKIYDAYDAFGNRWRKLPTEQNTFNYTEIYASACASTLLHGEDFEKLKTVKAKIRVGELKPADALSSVEELVKAYPGKADVLTTYGGILALLERHEEAMDAYWAAHQACRYYNRANWGLTLEKRYLEFSSHDDYNARAREVERELKGRAIPAEISRYILNWGALSHEAQQRVEYGARIWLPYMKSLLENKNHAYIKFAFDLLSESPGLESMRDERIGGDGYPNDNRLWDDVRGLGGQTVAADLSEVFQGVQGDYNLLGHEMTHQFQDFMEEKYPAGLTCVTNLYAAAKTAKNFADPYASQNKEEYFAQGVTYYLVPESSPKRFGLNRSWFSSHDPKLLAFLKSIEASRGDLAKIGCADLRTANIHARFSHR